jgi:hypothetical protein
MPNASPLVFLVTSLLRLFRVGSGGHTPCKSPEEFMVCPGNAGFVSRQPAEELKHHLAVLDACGVLRELKLQPNKPRNMEYPA